MEESKLFEFEEKLNSLKDWPDRNLILEITKFAHDNINYAGFIVNIVAAKCIDPLTNVTFVLPLFYLMDSIMKHVGGPYAALLARHIAEIFIRALNEVRSYPFNHSCFRLID
jgi:hypothetical protein